MRITNRSDLPRPLVEAVTPRKPDEKRISATQLIGPPRIRQLSLRHWDNISEDVTDRLWAIMGTAMHSLLESHGSEDALSEEYLSQDMTDYGFPGVTLTGRPDYYDADGVLWDWKFTSLWTFRDGVKPDWVRQLNVYAWLFRRHGFEIQALRILAVFRDWSRSDAERGLPPAQVYEVPMVSDAETEAYIRERVALHLNEPAEVCSADERWDTPTQYAVMKGTNKRALKLCSSRSEAEAEIEARGLKDGYIQERRGRSVRCEQYCPVSLFCDFGQAVLAAIRAKEEEA